MSRRIIMRLAPAVLASLLAISAVATGAAAQEPGPSTSTTRTTLVPGQAAVTKEGSPRNDAGLVVGAIAVGAIAVGATVLYLRYRGRGNVVR